MSFPLSDEHNLPFAGGTVIYIPPDGVFRVKLLEIIGCCFTSDVPQSLLDMDAKRRRCLEQTPIQSAEPDENISPDFLPHRGLKT